MVQKFALAAIVALFATASFANAEKKVDETAAPATEAGKEVAAPADKTEEKKPEEKK